MTTRVTVQKTLPVAAPAQRLWDYVTDWPRHAEWIPLTRTETIGGQARGVGGRFRARSGIGPLGFWDPMTVTRWEEHEDGSGFVGVVHTGRLVKGDAEITVTALGADRSELGWVEHFLLGRPGALGWRLASGFLDKTLDRALATLVANVEGRG